MAALSPAERLQFKKKWKVVDKATQQLRKELATEQAKKKELERRLEQQDAETIALEAKLEQQQQKQQRENEKHEKRLALLEKSETRVRDLRNQLIKQGNMATERARTERARTEERERQYAESELQMQRLIKQVRTERAKTMELERHLILKQQDAEKIALKEKLEQQQQQQQREREVQAKTVLEWKLRLESSEARVRELEVVKAEKVRLESELRARVAELHQVGQLVLTTIARSGGTAPEEEVIGPDLTTK
jgi:hypothetical protein